MSADGSVRCGNCDYWLGESAVELVAVETVKSGREATISRPRDLRLCKACGKVTVFIPRADLDPHRARAVASV